MASDPITTGSPCCGSCPDLSVTPTDPVSILRRLPEALFNPEAPTPPNLGAQWEDVFADFAQFGVVPGTEPTPQYELARVFAQEKDQFLLNWKRARALQLGLGKMTREGIEVRGQCPRAAGIDLDRLGAQYGVGRPSGFTDCCYWRLVQLLLWQRGPTLWRLLEIAELFTGQRPTAIETPALVTLAWPTPSGNTFFTDEQFLDDGGFYSGEPGSAPPDPLDSFWGNAPLTDSPLTFWGTGGAAAGMSLQGALDLVRPAGVPVRLQDVPLITSGCAGATKRGPAADFEFWA